MDKLKKIVADMLMVIVIVTMSGFSIAALLIGATHVKNGGSHFDMLVICMTTIAFTTGLLASACALNLYGDSNLRRRRKERRRRERVSRSFEQNPFKSNSEW